MSTRVERWRVERRRSAADRVLTSTPDEHAVVRARLEDLYAQVDLGPSRCRDVARRLHSIDAAQLFLEIVDLVHLDGFGWKTTSTTSPTLPSSRSIEETGIGNGKGITAAGLLLFTGAKNKPSLPVPTDWDIEEYDDYDDNAHSPVVRARGELCISRTNTKKNKYISNVTWSMFTLLP